MSGVAIAFETYLIAAAISLVVAVLILVIRNALSGKKKGKQA